MTHGLSIRPDGALDFVSLGALVHRLDPGIIPFRKATQCAIHVSGGEFNVAAPTLLTCRPTIQLSVVCSPGERKSSRRARRPHSSRWR